MQGAVSGRRYAFILDNAAGVPTPLNQYSPKGGISLSQETYDTTTADGSDSKSSMLGLRDGQEFTIEFLYHIDLWTMLTAIRALTTGDPQTYQFGPEGSTAGKPRVTGECFLKSFAVDSPTGEKTTMNATFIQTGAQTTDTF